MRLNTQRYREWKVRQNKKNLAIRTKKKEIIRMRRTKQIEVRRHATVNTEKFFAPDIFSLTRNPEETAEFFEKIVNFIIGKKSFAQDLFIDIAHIEYLSIDALMYLLAIVNNLNSKFKKNCRFRGNFPQDSKCRQLMRRSGFNKFVDYYGDEPIERSSDTVQIVSGDEVLPRTAKQICDFVIKRGNMTKKACSFLYNIIIELMSNSHNHAYSEKAEGILYSRWYCFADYDSAQDCIHFTFMDTGEGIPATVKRRGIEKLDILHLTNDCDYVISALRGDFNRSQTGLLHRGKGLPKIYNMRKENLIQDFQIISNHANVIADPQKPILSELKHPLKGTLFYWNIKLSF